MPPAPAPITATSTSLVMSTVCEVLCGLAIATSACHSRPRMNTTTGKVALVTGAARGIGLATAKRFIADGWRVALLDIDADNLKRAHKTIGKADSTLALTCDVAD